MREALWPVAAAFGALSTVRRSAYRAGWLPRGRVGVPVISVGGLSIGGSGKTPVAEYLSRSLLNRGLRVGVISGGYRGRARTRVLRVDHPSSPGSAWWFGDEAVMLARRLPEAIVVRGPDKLAAASLAARQGAQVVVIDDGFQHLRLQRCLDILLCGPGDGSVFPVGRGREPASARQHADLLWWHDRSVAMHDAQAASAGDEFAIASTYEPETLLDRAGQCCGKPEKLAGRRVFLLAGIALPRAFASTVANQGAVVVEQVFVRDHGALGPRALSRARRGDVDCVVCSEKDLVRWERDLDSWAGPPFLALRCRLRVLRGQSQLQRALQRVLLA